MTTTPTTAQKIATEGPVYPLPPSFTDAGALNTTEVRRYIAHLHSHGARTLMTTAGTTRFAHLNQDEIWDMGRVMADFAGTRIVGTPVLPTVRLLRWMDSFALDYGVDAFLVLYPDRFYNTGTLLAYFQTIAKEAPAPILVHAAPLRHATGGQWDYDPNVLEVLRQTPNIIGIKEECSTLDKAYEVSRWAQVNGKADDLVVISAGGSMRRFVLTNAAGAQTYLAGVGSFWPQIERDAWSAIRGGSPAAYKPFLRDWEDPLFDCFMQLGWHRCLAHGLHYTDLLQSGVREPWPHFWEAETAEIERVLDRLKEQL